MHWPKGPPTEAAYSMKAAKTNAPINAAKPITIRTRKNVVMPSKFGAGALVNLSNTHAIRKGTTAKIKRDHSL
jgi:hypothetical protein